MDVKTRSYTARIILDLGMQKSRRRFGTVTSVFLRRRRTGQSMRRGFEGELVRVGVMKGV